MNSRPQADVDIDIVDTIIVLGFSIGILMNSGGLFQIGELLTSYILLRWGLAAKEKYK